MEKIADHIFDNLEKELSRSNVKSYTDELCNQFYYRYILLEEHSDKFENESPLNIFYNKYYYFLSFSNLYQKLKGFDAGMQQQEFKIIEQGEQFPNIDWSIIEKIDNEIKSK